jgi:hypothetical protein
VAGWDTRAVSADSGLTAHSDTCARQTRRADEVRGQAGIDSRTTEDRGDLKGADPVRAGGRRRRREPNRPGSKTESGELNHEGREGQQRRPERAGGRGHKRIGGCGNPKARSDTMLGIDKLYFIGAKGHIYSTCTGMQICRKTL